MAMRMEVSNRAPHLAWARAGGGSAARRVTRRSGGAVARAVELLLPGERMGDDQVEIVKLGLPAEGLADAVGPGDDRRWVAGPARREAHGEVMARHALHGLDHLHH